MRISDWSSGVCSSYLFITLKGLRMAYARREQQPSGFPRVDRSILFQLDDLQVLNVFHEMENTVAAGSAGMAKGARVETAVDSSEERRVGREGVSTCRYWWVQEH